MERIIVNGGRRLSGEVMVGGSKNAALPILFGGIVTGAECVFVDLPRVSDVLQTLEILRYLGAGICFLANGEVRIDYSTVRSRSVPAAMTASIRGSTYLLGALLARFGHAFLGGAGGCNFGTRPIDQHLLGFSCLGASVTHKQDGVCVDAPSGLRGAEMHLAMPSVGATANLMLAAILADGESVLYNAAAEPHVAALADFLTRAGADIRGVGENTWCIKGVSGLHGVHYRIIPDMIEAGTYLCMGVACGGPVRVRRVCSAHLESLLDIFREMGVRVEVCEDQITVYAPNGYCNTAVTTGPYPAFPTDLHPQLAALFALGGRAKGEGEIIETVFASRFRYLQELTQMGAQAKVQDNSVRITPHVLRPACLYAPDLRGGAALLLAALATEGRSEIRNAAVIGRGYEHPAQKLRALGADVRVF